MTTLSLTREAALGLHDGLQDGLHGGLQEDFDHLLQALCINRRNAMVMCADTDELDTLARALSRRLKRTVGVQLEVMRPTSTEALLGRFNELVEALPLDKARSERHVEPTLTVWVMHLSRRLELPEVKLLLNMVQGFPGTGVRLLLLCSREAASAEAVQAAARWGSRLHRWVVSPAPAPLFEGAGVAKPPFAQPSARLAEAPSSTPVLTTPAPSEVVARASWMRACALALWARIRASGVRLKPVLRVLARALHKAWKVFDRVSGLGSLRAAMLARLRQLHPRWLWGVGSVLMSVGATAAAWWQARPGGDDASMSPLRRPVPEIVELLEDSRPHKVRQEQRS